jgi:hypothetical protein
MESTQPGPGDQGAIAANSEGGTAVIIVMRTEARQEEIEAVKQVVKDEGLET